MQGIDGGGTYTDNTGEEQGFLGSSDPRSLPRNTRARPHQMILSKN